MIDAVTTQQQTKLTGTILCHPLNRCLVYSSSFWNDPPYAIQYRPGGEFEFTLLIKAQQAAVDPHDLPEYPGEHSEFRDSILL